MAPERIHHPEYEPAGPKVLFLAHTDFVHKRRNPQERQMWFEKDGLVAGVLDAMGPAAILFSGWGELTQNGALLHKIHFSGDEETTQGDAKKLARWIKLNYPAPTGKSHDYHDDASWLPTVVVLEATGLSTDADVSFENLAFVDSRRIVRAMSQVPDIDYVIHPRGTCSDAYRFAEAHIPCLEMCIPVVGNFHTRRATMRPAQITKFRRAILAIDKEFS